MIFTTPTQYVILGLLLIVGWLFGLASHPGGAKWKRALQDEEVGNAAYRDEAETRARDDKKRIAELERSNASLRRDLEAAQGHVTVPAPATAAPVAASAAEPAGFAPAPPIAPEPEKKSWIGWGHDGDDLTKIRGIDATGAAKLKEQGVKSFRDITGLSHEDEMALEQRVGAPAGTIQRDQWRDQAELLADGKIEEHRARFWG